MSTAFFSHPDCERHEMGDGHPESPERLVAIREMLERTGLGQELQHNTPEEAAHDQLRLAHPEGYIQQLIQMAPQKGRIMADPDTMMMPHTLRAARLAAGAGVQAVDQVVTGQARNAFCAVRPPGHHAERNTTMGFCFFNNIAVAALHALNFHNLERVAIIDFDVHQGNGTVDIFRGDPRVLFCSSFQHPFFPNRGCYNEPENIVNVPLPAGTDSRDYREAVEARWSQALREFQPQLILVSAGFDAHEQDPLAEFELTTEDFTWVTNLITSLAKELCRGRVVSMLEGGYNLPALAAGVEAHLRGLVEAGRNR